MITTLKEILSHKMEWHGDSYDNVVHSTFSEERLNRIFLNSHGHTDCTTGITYTKDNVYLVQEYDGVFYAVAIPRNPEGL